jgi:putative SOS response-associated peptidase YedK
MECLENPSNNEWLLSFAIITTEPNELAAEVHDRMPVILQPRDYDRSLQRGTLEQLPTDLLRPYPAGKMTALLANPDVGNVKNNGPEMLLCLANTALWN